MMNLTHWRLLVAVADLGNITHAAEQVGITQSGASQAIAQIETALGIRIFVRDRRNVTLTAVGEAVIDHARTMYNHLEEIRGLAKEYLGVNNGHIRLACFPSIISTILPPLLRNFQRRHPNIELVALEGTDQEVEEWLASDTVDLGVVLNPSAERSVVQLGRDAWVAVVPNGHALGRRATETGVALPELASEPFILATGGCHVNAQSLMAEADLRLADIRVTVRDWGSACVLVKEGLGVALVPESTLPKDTRGLRIMPLNPSIHRTFSLACSKSGRSSLAAQALIKEIELINSNNNKLTVTATCEMRADKIPMHAAVSS